MSQLAVLHDKERGLAKPIAPRYLLFPPSAFIHCAAYACLAQGSAKHIATHHIFMCHWLHYTANTTLVSCVPEDGLGVFYLVLLASFPSLRRLTLSVPFSFLPGICICLGLRSRPQTNKYYTCPTLSFPQKSVPERFISLITPIFSEFWLIIY